MNVSRRQYLPPHRHHWRRTPPNCFLHDQPDLEMYLQSSPPPDALAGTLDPQSSSILATSYSLNLAICFNRSLLETLMSWVCPDPSMPYWNDSPSLASSLRWQASLHHRMLQPAHSMRVPSESASQWLQPPKWDAAGTSTTHPQLLQISLGAVASPEQRQTRRNATSAITGTAAAAGCGTLARHRCGIVSEAQRLRRAVAHRRVGGAASRPRRSGCGALWRIGASAARHSVRVELRFF